MTRGVRRGWMSLGAEGFCYDVSDSMLQMLDVQKSRFLVRNWINLVFVEDRETVRLVANHLQREALPAPVRLRFVRRDGTPIWLEIRFMRRRDVNQCRGEDLIIANLRRIRPEAAA